MLAQPSGSFKSPLLSWTVLEGPSATTSSAGSGFSTAPRSLHPPKQIREKVIKRVERIAGA